MVRLLVLNPKDHVAVVAEALPAGAYGVYTMNGEDVTVQALVDIPKYHKIAVKAAAKGENVLKYGEVIGRALQDIPVGDHVHTQNISDFREDA